MEHIFPQSLGGALCGSLFKTNQVCKRCNNVSGIFVDGAFIKSFFRTNDEAVAIRQYLDLDGKGTVPFAYMGTVQDLAVQNANDACELWLGPCGERVYHFHEKDDPRFDTFTGGDPLARRKRPGRAYLVLTSQESKWTSLTIRSFAANFAKAERYAVNFAVQGDGADKFIRTPNDAAKTEITLILAKADDTHLSKVALDLGFETRFLAKLALSLGHKVIGEGYSNSTYAKHLRSALWERDPQKRALIPARGTGFLASNNPTLDEIVSWPGGYTLMLRIQEPFLALSLHLPSGRGMHIAISDEPGIWPPKARRVYAEGQIFIVLPQLPSFVGPVPLPAYLAHKFGRQADQRLSALEKRRIDPATLPPCR
jgi:hypothetical protein